MNAQAIIQMRCLIFVLVLSNQGTSHESYLSIMDFSLSICLSGCAGTQLDRRLEEFFRESKNPAARYYEGGSYTRELRIQYKNYTCDELLSEYTKSYESSNLEQRAKQLVIWDLAKDTSCAQQIEKIQKQKVKESLEQQKKSQIAWDLECDKQEKRRLRREMWLRKEKAANKAADKVRTSRLLREIASEDAANALRR